MTWAWGGGGQHSSTPSSVRRGYPLRPTSQRYLQVHVSRELKTQNTKGKVRHSWRRLLERHKRGSPCIPAGGCLRLRTGPLQRGASLRLLFPQETFFLSEFQLLSLWHYSWGFCGRLTFYPTAAGQYRRCSAERLAVRCSIANQTLCGNNSYLYGHKQRLVIPWHKDP